MKANILPAETIAEHSSTFQVSDALLSAEITGWDVAIAVAVLVATYPIGALIQRLVERGTRSIPGVPQELTDDLGRLAKWLIYLIGLSVALTVLGFQLGWLTVVIGASLIVLVLMLRPMVENIAAGLLLNARPAFEVGDLIDTGQHRGTVIRIGSRTTVLETTDGLHTHIPNVDVVSGFVTVLTALPSRRAMVSVEVSREADLDELLPVLKRAIEDIEHVVEDPGVAVQAESFTEKGVRIDVSFWYPSSMPIDSSVVDQVIRALSRKLAELGIGEPSAPIGSAEMRVEARSTSMPQSAEDDDGAEVQ